MARVGLVLCAFFLCGCNSALPGLSAPQASAPPPADVVSTIPGVMVPPPSADLDCAPRPGAITCP